MSITNAREQARTQLESIVGLVEKLGQKKTREEAEQ